MGETDRGKSETDRQPTTTRLDGSPRVDNPRTATVKAGPRLVLDHMAIYQVLSDPAFFTAVPAFFFLRDVAKATTDKVKQAALDGSAAECYGCGGVKQIMQPAIAPFVATLAELAAKAPDALTPLADYVAARRGFRPTPIVVYYKRDGRTLSVEF